MKPKPHAWDPEAFSQRVAEISAMNERVAATLVHYQGRAAGRLDVEQYPAPDWLPREIDPDAPPEPQPSISAQLDAFFSARTALRDTQEETSG